MQPPTPQPHCHWPANCEQLAPRGHKPTGQSAPLVPKSGTWSGALLDDAVTSTLAPATDDHRLGKLYQLTFWYENG